jgi:glycosyltransferase involved in cell wall biosynthesis
MIMTASTTNPTSLASLETLSGQQIVYLSHQRWNTHTTPVHHIAERLSRENLVLFVEPPESVAWLFHEPPAREALTWSFNPLEQRSENFYIYHTPPLFLPWAARSRWISQATLAMQLRHVRYAMRRLNIERPICWIFQFNVSDLLPALNPSLTVYECAEDYAAYETRDWVRRYVEGHAERLCRECDCVLVPSEKMARMREWVGNRLHLIPWGVDVPHYAKARETETPIPPELDKLPRPIIGMFGMLDGRRMHYDLVLHLARRHRDWSIALVGRCMPNLNKELLDAEPNIHFFGMQPVDALPGFCKGFDVCMIPYRLNQFTEAIMPLKLTEYLATGKPCVSTELPAAKVFKDVIHVADSIESFEQGVIAALKQDTGQQRRIERANEFDWEVIGSRRLAVAAQSLRKKQAAEARP